MPTKPIDRLLFTQGGECFFCKQTLAKTDASLEHLVAQTHGGKDNDENLVVCCKTLNNLFGRMSLKEKLDVILKQRGMFRCPGQSELDAIHRAKSAPAKASSPAPKPDTPLAVVVSNLKSRGNSRPGRLDKLVNTIKVTLEHQKHDVAQADKVLAQLRSHKWVQIEGDKVSYQLPAGQP